MRGLRPAHLHVMALGFHPDRYVAFPGTRAVVLDVAADRYWRLSEPLSAGLADLLAGAASPSAATLISCGIVLDDPAARPLALAADVRPDDRCRITATEPVTSFAATAWAMVAVRNQLRRGGLKRSLAAAARRARQMPIDKLASADACARRFEQYRAWLPLPPRCLPDGLALHAVLCQQGIAAQLVIGVRDQPFAAHCWVEAHGQVLNDPLAIVAELTPILIL